jgi:lipopolysaccharide transport system ATP-binding protein
MSDVAIEMRGIGKMYKVFPSRTANLLDALGLPGPRRYREFWALKDIDLELERGGRIGVVGRNGAGKSTLLKLITQNISPTEGSLRVNGAVQALIEVGAGFHPEFTGEENIRAALTLQGARPARMKALIDEIMDFTELGEFLFQPFRTYSAGMQARLAFATATAIEPEILIIDEVLSAGDAYFAAKVSERMRALVDSGASVVLVSHSLDHITMFCDEAIWVDRGHIVRRGRPLDVVKAYQQFTRALDERRLKAKNRKARQGVATHLLDNYAETLTARITLPAGGLGALDVERVALWRGDELEDEVRVGDAQDADDSHAAFVVLDGGAWSDPAQTERGLCRRLMWTPELAASGSVAFNLYSFFEDETYRIELTCRGAGLVRLELLRGATAQASIEFEAGSESDTYAVELRPDRAPFAAVGAAVSDEDYAQPVRVTALGERVRRPPSMPDVLVQTLPAAADDLEATHWEGEGSVTIENALLLGPQGEQAVYEVGSPITFELHARAHRDGVFPIIPVAVLYRLDGIAVSTHIGERIEARLSRGDQLTIRLEFARVDLGDGPYVFSAALYRRLEDQGNAETYDLVDRSYEFEIVGNDPLYTSIYRLPAQWTYE